MVTAASRREARERALELLYEAEAKGCHPEVVVDALPLRPDDYALELAYGVADHQIELDALIGRFATERWPVRRMAVMDRAVLRLGAFELCVHHAVPTGAALSEAVELGATYGSSDDTSKFVNGILSNLAREVRGPDEAPDRTWFPIEVVVFDMDGVIRHWDEAQFSAVEGPLGLPDGTIASVAFADPLFAEAMTGKRSAEEWFAEIGRRVADAHGVDHETVAGAFSDASWTLDDQVVSLIRRLRSNGVPTALFSNASTRLGVDIETMGLTHLFDHVGNSALIGRAKPDVAAFERVAADLDVSADHLLFVDDLTENVEGAVRAGWHAVVFRGAARLEAVCRRLGLLPGA